MGENGFTLARAPKLGRVAPVAAASASASGVSAAAGGSVIRNGSSGLGDQERQLGDDDVAADHVHVGARDDRRRSRFAVVDDRVGSFGAGVVRRAAVDRGAVHAFAFRGRLRRFDGGPGEGRRVRRLREEVDPHERGGRDEQQRDEDACGSG